MPYQSSAFWILRVQRTYGDRSIDDTLLSEFIEQPFCDLRLSTDCGSTERVSFRCVTQAAGSQRTLYAPLYWPTSSPIMKTFGSLVISSSIAWLRASLQVIWGGSDMAQGNTIAVSIPFILDLASSCLDWP